MHETTLRSSFGLAVAVALAFAVPGAPAQDGENLKTLAAEYWQATLQRDPVRATRLGDHRYDDQLDDRSLKAIERWREQLGNLESRLKQIDPSGLSDDDALTRDLLEHSLRDDILRTHLADQFTPLDPLNGAHIRFPLVLNWQPFRNAKDFEQYVGRLRAFSRQTTDAIAAMRRGIGVKFVQPRVIVEKLIPQLQTHIVSDARESVFFAPLREHGDVLSDDQRQVVEKQIIDAIQGDVVPSYLRLLAFVQEDYLYHARESFGLGQSPGGQGKRMYAALARLHTTTRLSPDEIHEIGLAELGRIRDEMSAIKEKVRFEGSLEAFLTHMRTDASFRFKSREQILSTFSAILNQSKPRMTELFTKLPEADVVMKEIEAFRAPAAPVAYYGEPDEQATRPGYFYINTYAPNERLTFTAEALTYHEAIPGHHFQMSLNRENTSLPAFRRHAGFTAFIEGWALYTERLGHEIGGYTDPYQEFGRLTFEAWRACRLVVDTGIHEKGWSRDKAIEFMTEHTSLASLDIEAEVDRYIAWPGQALGYKIGEIRIREIRARAERMLGDGFDLRAFHDELLSQGALPMELLEKRMNAWIQRHESKAGAEAE